MKLVEQQQEMNSVVLECSNETLYDVNKSIILFIYLLLFLAPVVNSI